MRNNCEVERKYQNIEDNIVGLLQVGKQKQFLENGSDSLSKQEMRAYKYVIINDYFIGEEITGNIILLKITIFYTD
jgi:hypothetical protein